MAGRQRAALIAGSLLSLVALLPPVIGFANQRLTLHMLFEMLLLALAVPLLAYGAAPRLRSRFSVGLQSAVGVLALNLVLFAWQIPAVLDMATRNIWLREAAPAVFMLGALVFWQPIVRRDGLSAIAKIGYLMVAGVPPTIPGITLAFSHHLLYHAYRSIEDQQIAGLLLFGTAKLTLVAGTFVILWRMLAPDKEPPDWEIEEAPVDDTPPTAPAWLRRLDEELPAESDRPRLPVGAGR
ncbi:MAG TPA: cytochrome c oxidase assembly protein [Candidatus Dormibacteraeota bacterium]|nr:cytochrome c oxidase assembly protein [Candidatus Dormibacteraeota bacterium]